jgi:hypothetical protein
MEMSFGEIGKGSLQITPKLREIAWARVSTLGIGRSDDTAWRDRGGFCDFPGFEHREFSIEHE